VRLKFKITTIILTLFLGLKLNGQESRDSLAITIEEAKQYALENNFSMKNARRDVEAAKKKVWETTAIGLPQINGGIDYTNNIVIGGMPLTQPSPSTGQDTTIILRFGTPHSLAGNLTVSQLIFDGSYIVGLQSAITYKQISKLAEAKTETLVEEAVTNAYGNAILIEESIAILENNVKTLQDNYNQINALYKAGLGQEQDVEQIQILLSSTQNVLFKAKREKALAYQMLQYTLGLDFEQPVKLTNGVEFLLLENIDTLSLGFEDFDPEKNIDYAIQENDVESQKLLKKLEQSKFLPTLSAFYQTRQEAFRDNIDFLDKDQYWVRSQMLGVKLTVPIFSSGSRLTRVQQAKIEVEKSKTRQEELKFQLIMDFENAQSDYITQIHNFFTARSNMDLSMKIREKESIKFFEGMSSSLDLSNAEQQMFQSQTNYIGAIQSLIAAKSKMDRLLKEVNIED
jgi:outer membrane protein TolC